MKECVIIDGVRSANVRAHKEKGWFRHLMPDEILTKVYDGLFSRNPKVKPKDVDAVFCGCSHATGTQWDIGRFAWLAGGFPDTVPSNTIAMMCPSGMAAVQHAARAIMCDEGDIFVCSGIDDMLNVPQGLHLIAPKRFVEKYADRTNMGITAETVAERWNIGRKDQELMAYWSHKRAHAATQAGKFKSEIIPIEGLNQDGQPILVDTDQWIRPEISMEEMAGMKTPFKQGGVVSAATASPFTTGAAALLVMSREKADALSLDYHVKYAGGVMAGCDPEVMGIGPIYAVPMLLKKKGLTTKDISVWELNEAFGSQSVAVLRELGLGYNAPFENVNVWGGALALGHPLGASGARLIGTLANIMKTDYKEAKYGIATLCGGIGSAGAVLLQKAN